MNLPNKLTLLRIILIPVFMVVLYWGFPGATWVALAHLHHRQPHGHAGRQDRRKYNLVTDFGKFADPLADKMLVTAAMLWFVEIGQMPAWMLLIVICREFAVSGLRMIASDKGRVIAAGWSGKVQDCRHYGVRGADVPAHSTGGEHALRVGHHPHHPVLWRRVFREEQGCHRLGVTLTTDEPPAGHSRRGRFDMFSFQAPAGPTPARGTAELRPPATPPGHPGGRPRIGAGTEA